MKIVRCDNFGTKPSGRDELLIGEIVSEAWADRILELLIEEYCDDHGPYSFKAVPDDYELKVFKP